MRSIFILIFRYFSRHPRLFWVYLLASLLICVLLASRIQIEQDINKMIPHDPAVETMNSVLNKTKVGEQVIFTVYFKDTTVTDPDSLIALQMELEEEIKSSLDGYVKRIESVVDDSKEQQFIDIAIDNLPLFLDDADYLVLDSLTTDTKSIENSLAKARQLLLSPAGMVVSQWIARDPIGMMNFAFEKFRNLNLNPDYELYKGYVFNKGNKQLNFFLTPVFPASATGRNKVLFQGVDEILDAWEARHPQAAAFYFGGAAVAASNAAQMQQDTFLTLSITVILLSILTWYVFRKKRAPFLLLLPVVFGGVFGLAVTYLVQGSISILAIGTGAIILGVAIDFSIHFMSHARSGESIEETVKNLVNPLTLGAFTTIAAFFALRFTHAPLLQDLGLFASTSLLGASIFTLVFLPHLLKKNTLKQEGRLVPSFIDRLAVFRPEKNKYVLIGVIIATPILWYYSGDVKFDGDLMHLNYLSPQLKKAQEQLNEDNTFALGAVYVVAEGDTEEEAALKLGKARKIMERLKEEGAVKQTLNPLEILPSVAVQKEKIERWQQFWSAGRREKVIRLVKEQAVQSGFSAAAFDGFEETLDKNYDLFDDDAKSFLKSLMPNAYGTEEGHFLISTLKIQPGERKKVLEAFDKQDEVLATDSQSVSEALLGTVVGDFNQVLWVSGLLVFLTLLITYGRIELALISFLPLAITWVWILGMMSIIGLEFNIVNIMISTLIFGLGDDYSIFMMDGLMAKYKSGENRIASTRSAVYLSVLTTVIGLGTLVFAQHPALKSIALIAVLGLLCVVFVSQVIQPFLFNFLIQSRADRGFMPFTLWSLAKSAFSFFYFFTGCFLLTIVGSLLIGLKPFGKERSKLVFHFLVSKYAKSVLYVMGNLKKRVINLAPDTFKQPAIYIANHSSFLDILAMTMLHPKLILLTNRWVWRSPVFGRIVRMAEYYPVAEGAERSIGPLHDLVRRGYGIVVFPEGTRSKDDTIHRFKKGAFFLAEKLNLNVVPVLLHGISYAMQKGDWLLKDGSITVKVMPAIAQENLSFGSGYSERGKMINRWFRKQFKLEKRERETPQYFKEQIVKSNIYKGPVLEWYCRVKIKLEDYYEPFHKLLPESGFFYDLGCGYGFMTYMLQWAAPGRKFKGYDYDEEKIITASHNYVTKHGAQNGNILFEQADLRAVELSPCDGIIISDALHYLLPSHQAQLLGKCHAALKKDGVLIIRDGVSDLERRHKRTKLTEFFSTRLFKFNKTTNKLYFLDQDFLKSWATDHQMDIKIIDNSSKTSNLIFLLKKTTD